MEDKKETKVPFKEAKFLVNKDGSRSDKHIFLLIITIPIIHISICASGVTLAVTPGHGLRNNSSRTALRRNVTPRFTHVTLPVTLFALHLQL